MKYIYIMYELIYAHAQLCRHPPYICITCRNNRLMIYMGHFQELPDQEVTKTPSSLSSPPTYSQPWEELPSSVTLLLALQSAIVMSFWGHITCIKLAFMYPYHLNNIFPGKKEYYNVGGEMSYREWYFKIWSKIPKSKWLWPF